MLSLSPRSQHSSLAECLLVEQQGELRQAQRPERERKRAIGAIVDVSFRCFVFGGGFSELAID